MRFLTIIVTSPSKDIIWTQYTWPAQENLGGLDFGLLLDDELLGPLDHALHVLTSLAFLLTEKVSDERLFLACTGQAVIDSQCTLAVCVLLLVLALGMELTHHPFEQVHWKRLDM